MSGEHAQHAGDAAADTPARAAARGTRSEGTRRARGVSLSPRRTFIAVAVVLGVVLVALIAYLVWLLRPTGLTQEGGPAQSGLIPVLAIYGPGTGSQPKFASPMGAAWGQGDRIYAADTKNNRIVVFSRTGRYEFQFGGFGVAKPPAGAKATWKPGLLDYPTGVAADPDNGDVFVADFYNDSISVFDANGTFLRRFPDPAKRTGKGGSGGNGTGIAVTALTVAGGKVYATDTYQVVVFDEQGNVLQQIGMPGLAPGDFDHPNGIAVDSRGRIYVADSNHSRVTALSSDGKVLWTVGSKGTALTSQTVNPFVLPRGLTVLTNGSILVADPMGQQIIRLDDAGKVLAHYGARGSDPGQLNFPNAVAARNDLILVADRQNNRIQVVRLGADEQP